MGLEMVFVLVDLSHKGLRLLLKCANVCRLHFSLRIHKLVHICESYPAELNIFNHIAYFVQ